MREPARGRNLERLGRRAERSDVRVILFFFGGGGPAARGLLLLQQLLLDLARVRVGLVDLVQHHDFD